MLSDRWNRFRRRGLFPALLGIAAVAALSWGIYQYRLRADYEKQIRNMYTRSFYELVNNMDNVQNQLSKLMVSNSPGGNVQLLSEISRQADNAGDQIAHLPLTHPSLSDTMGLIALTGDYCRSLADKAADGHPLTGDDIGQLMDLYNSCQAVTEELKKLQAEGRVEFVSIDNRAYYDGNTADEISGRFSDEERGGVEYPTLIYDGPFSESIANAEPRGLPPEPVDEAGAKAAAAQLLGVSDPNAFTVTGMCSGKIETYMLEGRDSAGAGVTLQVTKLGGKVLQTISESGSAQPTLDAGECVQRAGAWLAGAGFPQMTATFYQQYDGNIVINFAPLQDNAVLYTDLVKVKVRMDDGSVVGLDATGYWMNHRDRGTLSPIIAEQDARKLVSPQLSVNGSRLSLIPMSGGGEQLCWEFSGMFGGDTFYVYIDAVTGEEAEVLKIINTENGSLAV